MRIVKQMGSLRIQTARAGAFKTAAIFPAANNGRHIFLNKEFRTEIPRSRTFAAFVLQRSLIGGICFRESAAAGKGFYTLVIFYRNRRRHTPFLFASRNPPRIIAAADTAVQRLGAAIGFTVAVVAGTHYGLGTGIRCGLSARI